MKLRPGPLFVLLLSSISSIQSLEIGSDTQRQDHALIRGRDVQREPDPAVPAAGAQAAKADASTKFAPHDGHDGLPHVGPNVRPLEEQDAKDKSSSGTTKAEANRKTKQSAEDSVMNDKNRQAPKKGTTGTEGGVSEKEKARKEKEALTGEKQVNKPASPKQAPKADSSVSDSHSGSGSGSGSSNNNKPSKKTEHLADIEAGRDTGDKKGAPGLKKPENLPNVPHGVHPGLAPKPKAGSESDSEDEGHLDDQIEDVKWDALVGSFSSIAVTEIGDKTFIVAALMAMRHPRLQVFTAAFSALALMTILSAITGHAVGALISKRFASLLAAGLFFFFGAKSLREGFDMDPNQGVGDEMREVEAELEEKEVDIARQEGRRRTSSISPYALEAGRASRSRSKSRLEKASRTPSTSPSSSTSGQALSTVAGIKNLLSLLLSPAWVETFSMTFIGELGDRSQIATVAMAAGQEYFWIMVGATLGHFVCTAAAVIGGSVLAGRITMRKVTLIGGAIFIGFGLFTLFEAYENWS